MTVQIYSVKFLGSRGVSHHTAFMGSYLTIISIHIRPVYLVDDKVFCVVGLIVGNQYADSI